MNEIVRDLIVEAVEEATGMSTKKWALAAVALVTGMAITWWATRR